MTLVHQTLSKLRDPDASPYVIAEAGVNHGADIETALAMIRGAVGVGIDAVKFQTYKADRIAARRSDAYWDMSKEPTGSQFELFKKYDRFGPEEYRALAQACSDADLTFMTTPFDVDCVEWLDPLVPHWKIASADITNLPLLRTVAATGKEVLLSTGGSTLSEIEDAVDELERGGAADVCLLHCTLAYPTAREDAAIGAIAHLRRAFPGHVLGYSDHTVPEDSFAAIAAAVTLGARVVEKHYSLDTTLPGNDHYHAFEPHQFARLRQELDQLLALVGDGRKRVLASERASRLHARRSLVTRVRLSRGTILRPELLDIKRPGTGIETRYLDHVLGMRVARDIDEDVTLTWDMLEHGDGAG
jgi:sialic acid synthase SpsE